MHERAEDDARRSGQLLAREFAQASIGLPNPCRPHPLPPDAFRVRSATRKQPWVSRERKSSSEITLEAPCRNAASLLRRCIFTGGTPRGVVAKIYIKVGVGKANLQFVDRFIATAPAANPRHKVHPDWSRSSVFSGALNDLAEKKAVLSDGERRATQASMESPTRHTIRVDSGTWNLLADTYGERQRSLALNNRLRQYGLGSTRLVGSQGPRFCGPRPGQSP